MKKQISGLLAAVLLVSGLGVAGAVGTEKHTVADADVSSLPVVENIGGSEMYNPSNINDVSTDYISPLVTMRADPFLYKKDGMYYFTGSYPQYDRIEVTCADSINGIAAAVPKTIWKMPDNLRPTLSGQAGDAFVWAPEIHYVMGQWVVYYTFSVGNLWDIRSHALICKGQDPMNDEWENVGLMQTTATDDFSFKSWGFSLDMTVYENDGHWYAVWAQKGPKSNIYLAELETPYKLKTEPVLLTQPEYAWEKNRETVDEGPGVFKHGGKVYVTFSGSATGYEYCMGLLEIDDDKDPLIKSNWKKYDQPVFTTDESMKIYGPGHNNFVEGDNGELLCILHFRNYKDITGDSLYDYNRHAHVMKMRFDETGLPIFHYDPEDIYNSQFTNHGK